MNWISVKERLPEKGKQVLIFDGISVEMGDARYHENNKGMLITFVIHDCCTAEDVTHWMELPESPKDKQ